MRLPEYAAAAVLISRVGNVTLVKTKRKTNASREGCGQNDVLRLEDLDPQRDIRGGAGKHVFGETSASLKSEVESLKTHMKATKENRHDHET